MEKITLFLIFLTALVNFIGVLGPELSFDALWYHLTLPKIYLMEKSIKFIPGGLLYYSAMPRLGEIFYTFALLVSDERLAKLIHFTFGLLAAFFTYKIGREFLNKKYSLLATLIFYSTLIVGWLSTTAYVDLQRTAFEGGSLFFFLRWWRKNEGNGGIREYGGKEKSLFFSALFLGLAISTKLLAIGSILIFLILIIIKKKKSFLLFTFYFLLFTFLPVLPWLIFAYKTTGNPIYPIGSGILDTYHRIPSFNLISFFGDFWDLILRPQDPISPIFLIILPIGLMRLMRNIREMGKIKGEKLALLCYGFFSYIIWYFTPRTGGGRFILPYLLAWSVLTAITIKSLREFKLLKGFLISIILLVSLVHLGYRFIANKKYLPFILGKQTKKEFLCSNLDFSTNVFYDCDGFFKKNIKKTDKVLIYCSHNLYYVDFPFIHESWLKEGDKFNYVMSQNCKLPGKFKNLPMIYENKKTGVKLYQAISN